MLAEFFIVLLISQPRYVGCVMLCQYVLAHDVFQILFVRQHQNC